MKKLLLILFTLFLSSISVAEEYDFIVLRVIDGDTLQGVKADSNPLNPKENKTVRLWGIDAPEMNQPFGEKAKWWLGLKATNQTVHLVEHGHDLYGRIIGDLTIKSRTVENINLSQEMLKQGLAWWYRDYAKNNPILQALEAAAQDQKVGIWQDQKAVAPWIFRQQKR